MEAVIFYLFCGLCLGGLLLMLLTSNVIHGAYGLTLVLLSVAAFFVYLQADYLAAVQLFMYAGGIVVLLVFGIMLTNRSKKGPPLTKHRAWLLPVLFTTVFGWIIYRQIEITPTKSEVVSADQTKLIGIAFMTDQILSFELIAVILLVVLVGAAYLAKKSSINE